MRRFDKATSNLYPEGFPMMADYSTMARVLGQGCIVPQDKDSMEEAARVLGVKKLHQFEDTALGKWSQAMADHEARNPRWAIRT
jgi:hypothetical protein